MGVILLQVYRAEYPVLLFPMHGGYPQIPLIKSYHKKESPLAISLGGFLFI